MFWEFRWTQVSTQIYLYYKLHHSEFKTLLFFYYYYYLFYFIILLLFLLFFIIIIKIIQSALEEW